MRSVKPGRGPSFMGAIGAVAVVIFGIIWTIAVSAMGAPVFFPLFGVVFIILGIAAAVYNFKNATGENRFSTFDITDDREEPDPLNLRYGRRDGGGVTESTGAISGKAADHADSRSNFCPYCGEPTGCDHEFCRNCGKKLS